MILARIALRNLFQAKTRSSLLGFAIALVTAMLVLMLSLAGGIEDNLVRSATTLSSGHVTVAGFFKSSPSDAAPVVTEAAKIRAILERETPGLDYIVDRQRGWAKIISPTGSVQVGLSGVNLSQESRLAASLEIAPEREYLPDGGDAKPGRFEDIEKPHSVVLFANQARRLAARVGDSLTVQTETRGGQTNTIDLIVVAVVRDVGVLSSFALFMNADDLRTLYQLNPDTTGAFWLYLKDIDDSEDVMTHLRGVLAREGFIVMDHVSAPFFFKFDSVAGEDWLGQKIDLTIWSDEVSFLTWVLTAFDTVTFLLSALLVAIIAIGIMNALYNAIRERTREIGTLRAIGMQRIAILNMFLLEALFLGALSTLLGAALGSALALWIDSAHIAIHNDAVRSILLAETLHLVVRPAAVSVAALALTTLTALAAILPAARAARLPPITAMQHAD